MQLMQPVIELLVSGMLQLLPSSLQLLPLKRQILLGVRVLLCTVWLQLKAIHCLIIQQLCVVLIIQQLLGRISKVLLGMKFHLVYARQEAPRTIAVIVVVQVELSHDAICTLIPYT